MPVNPFYYVILSTAFFFIGLLGLFINSHQIIDLLMCIELLLLSINTQFIALSQYFGELSGQIMVFFVLTITACETAIALAILVLVWRISRTVTLTELNQLKD